MSGNETDGVNNATLIRVPIRYGDASRNAQTIIQENSASSLPSTPLMTFYITGLDYARDRLQEPYHVSNTTIRQRTYDEVSQTYETTQGNAFTVERLMPVPYNLTINLDIWTSNTNQKLQLFEQISTLFNPSLEIQSTDNFIDWTSLSVMYLDGVTFTSRTIPQGQENPIDIMTMKFSMPIWISSPAKIKKLGIVEKVIMSMYDEHGDANEAISNNDLLLGTRLKVTLGNYKILVIDNQIQVLAQRTIVPNGSMDSLDPVSLVGSSPLLWPAVMAPYGAYRPGLSQIRLLQPNGTEIVGTIVVNPNDERLVIFTPDADTVPQNTMSPITAIINPLTLGPDSGLPAPVVGTRYLLTEDTGDWSNVANPEAWLGELEQPLIAHANDIIEFTAQNRWRVTFVAREETDLQYVTNITTGYQYEWTGAEWIKSYQGEYAGGDWSLVL